MSNTVRLATEAADNEDAYAFVKKMAREMQSKFKKLKMFHVLVLIMNLNYHCQMTKKLQIRPILLRNYLKQLKGSRRKMVERVENDVGVGLRSNQGRKQKLQQMMILGNSHLM